MLFLVKEWLFPEIRQRRIVAGAFFWSASYVLWRILEKGVSRLISQSLAVVLFCFPLFYLFPIKSWKTFLKVIRVLVFHSFLLGGSAFWLRGRLSASVRNQPGAYGLLLLFMAAMAGFLAVWRRYRHRGDGEKAAVYEVEIRRKGKQKDVRGLYDSGNLLQSTIAGGGVCILEMGEAEALMNEKEKAALTRLLSCKKLRAGQRALFLQKGIYWMEYTSVGKEGGWMPGIMADRIIVKKDGQILTEKRRMVGIVSQNLSEEGRFSMLLPADIFSDRK